MVTYLCPRLEPQTALGRAVRRAGVLDGLRSRGADVRVVELPPGSSRLPTFLRLIPAAAEIRRVLRGLDPREAVVLEGADVALAAALVTRRGMHVDVCDAVRLLADIGRRPGLRGAVRHRLKHVLAGLALRAVRRVATSVSYISERDLACDRSALDGIPAFVVGVGHGAAASERDAAGPFVVVGDWAYPPNAEMLEQVMDWLGSWEADRPERLRVVGPHLDAPPQAPGVVRTGWIDDLAVGFRGAACALAPIESGAGVKNKVVAALTHGVPVVASPEALNGIPPVPMVKTWEPGLTPEAAHAWAGGVDVVTDTGLPTWDAVVAPLAEQLRRSEGSLR